MLEHRMRVYFKIKSMKLDIYFLGHWHQELSKKKLFLFSICTYKTLRLIVKSSKEIFELNDLTFSVIVVKRVTFEGINVTH